MRLDNGKKLHFVRMVLFVLIAAMPIIFVGTTNVMIDPYFHYHKPNIEKFYYVLDNQRCQNDGIARHFDYGGIITGTSVTENFKTSEAEVYFNTTFIKVPFSGGTFKEINDCVKTALNTNRDEIEIVIRSLDYGHFFDDVDAMREDMGVYPTYLYDDNYYNDIVNYILNRQLLWERTLPMVKNSKKGKAGITSFNIYSNWMKSWEFGNIESFYKDEIGMGFPEQKKITDEEIETVRNNIIQNVTSIADDNPDVTFFYFFPPVSAAWYHSRLMEGSFERYMDAERIVIEEILKYDNIRIFGFDALTDIATDLNNYKDYIHYGDWVNSYMLKCMSEGQYEINGSNYLSHLNMISNFYNSFDYSSLANYSDYENDYMAACIMNRDYYGVSPLELNFREGILCNAVIREDLIDGQDILFCEGTLDRNFKDISIEEYVKNTNDYVGVMFDVDDISEYRYLSMDGKKDRNEGYITVVIYTDSDTVIFESKSYKDLDKQWHQYVFDISDLKGCAKIVVNGGYTDFTGSCKSTSEVGNVVLY